MALTLDVQCVRLIHMNNTLNVKQTDKIGRPLRAALALAELSKCKQRHGAVLMKNGVVIAAGTNINKEPTTDSNFRSCAIHAEAAVVSQAGTAATGATVYVARMGRSGNPLNSAPCKRCEGLMKRRGIKRVYHT